MKTTAECSHVLSTGLRLVSTVQKRPNPRHFVRPIGELHFEHCKVEFNQEIAVVSGE